MKQRERPDFLQQQWGCCSFCHSYFIALLRMHHVRKLSHSLVCILYIQDSFVACNQSSQCGNHSVCEGFLCRCDMGFFTPDGTATNCRDINGNVCVHTKYLLSCCVGIFSSRPCLFSIFKRMRFLRDIVYWPLQQVSFTIMHNFHIIFSLLCKHMGYTNRMGAVLQNKCMPYYVL